MGGGSLAVEAEAFLRYGEEMASVSCLCSTNQ